MGYVKSDLHDNNCGWSLYYAFESAARFNALNADKVLTQGHCRTDKRAHIQREDLGRPTKRGTFEGPDYAHIVEDSIARPKDG